MMKISIVLVFFLIFGILKASGQTIISYDTHAIQAGYLHKTQKIQNVDQGKSGNECFWDFGSLICGEFNQSDIQEAEQSAYFSLFPASNLAINSGSDQFFFQVNHEQLEYMGYVTQEAVIHFDTPIIRMKYPFQFGDKIEGTFTGTGIHNQVVQTVLTGNYSVEADGKGNLLLPNGVSISNALRVKTIEHYIETACNTVEWTITKYLWYTSDYRYPVFTLIQKDIFEGENVKHSNDAFYNEEAFLISSAENKDLLAQVSLNLYPNPSTDKITISYILGKQQNVTIDLFSLLGSKIRNIVENQKQKGAYTYELSAVEMALVPGVYLIKFSFGDKSITRKIIIEY